MTKREFLTKIAAGEMNEEIMAMGVAEIEKMDAALEKRKGVKSKKDLEKAEANQVLINQIVGEILGTEPMTATDVAGVLELTVQKSSSLLRAAVKQNENKVGQTDVKIKGKGTQKGYFLIG